jgi:hypothetical protein
MKKILFIAAVACFVTTSCKKDYTCTCTSTGFWGNTTSTAHAKMKKNDAETWCSSGNSSYSSGGVTYNTSCILSK